MFTELSISILLGISAGIITGLTPGIHINLVALLAVSISPLLLQQISPISLGAFIIAMSVNHSFLDSIPGIYLGAPDEDQALSILPGHKMLLKGEGYNAVKLTIIGSFFSLLVCISLSPIFILLVKLIYPIIKEWIGYILIMIMLYMILKDSKRKDNLIIFSLAGLLGLITLNIPNLNNPLFPLLSGLFGFSILFLSLMQNSTIPKQKTDSELKLEHTKKAIAGAAAVGFIASFLPGLGSSQAAIIATQILKDIGDKGFLILVGGINTVNFTLSLITLFMLDKARNGAVLALKEIIGSLTLKTLAVYLISALITGSIAIFLALKIARLFSNIISKINYRKLVLTIIALITGLALYFSGIIGIIILIVSTSLGIYASSLGVGKNHCMGCLILPVILYFIL